MLKQFLIVWLGGGIGSMLRYAIYLLIKPGFFPFATLMVNISGSLFLGFIMGVSMKQTDLDNNWKLFLTTGLSGGFTTFSAFSFENLQLIQNGKPLIAFLYIVLSVTISLLAAFLGYKIAL